MKRRCQGRRRTWRFVPEWLLCPLLLSGRSSGCTSFESATCSGSWGTTEQKTLADTAVFHFVTGNCKRVTHDSLSMWLASFSAVMCPSYAILKSLCWSYPAYFQASWALEELLNWKTLNSVTPGWQQVRSISAVTISVTLFSNIVISVDKRAETGADGAK